MTPEETQIYLSGLLDSLQAAGVNAVLWQVRPSADAFYPSTLEPWSCYISTDGRAPRPEWDPLQYMIEGAHERGMELHAWLNPYRVTASKGHKPQPGHLYYKHPERFVTYGGQIYFDPGIPENREHIQRVVADIVNRYDIDGIHLDDYFYPYPIKGQKFPDSRSYKRYGRGMELGDWRRHNVDLLIEGLNEVIWRTKPWVRFGVSPFGIWRNRGSDPRGSDTNGLQNYDDLYADVLLWAQKGWIDYLAPQLYWDYSTKAAPYDVLMKWWGTNAGNRHMYIGQDIGITMKKGALSRKMTDLRSRDDIQGVCWWPGYSILKNVYHVADSLQQEIQPYPALVPSYPWMGDTPPPAPKHLRAADRTITWKAPRQSRSIGDVNHWAIYRFAHGEMPDINRPECLVAVTYQPTYTARDGGVYVVTALDRTNNESSPSRHITLH